jgi:ankyrin repeat protein
LIAYYQARILDTDQKLEFEEATKGAYSGKELESSNLRIEVLGNARRLYNQYKQYIEKARWQFATSYEEAPLTQLVSLLTAGMGRGGEALTVLTICRDNIRIYGEIIDVDEDKIYLYNHDGRSHFNLWFSKNDQICQELEPQVRLLQETKTKEQAGQLEKFNQLKQEILKQISTIDIVCVNDILGSSTLEDLEFNQENLLKLDLLKSIKDANSIKESLTKSNIGGSLQKSEINKSEIDPEICYQLALEEIVKNDQPSDIFTTYLEEIKRGGHKKPQERALAHIVAMRGKEKFLEPILRILPASFSEKDQTINFGNTPLIWAIANAKNKFVQTLLEKAGQGRSIGILNIDYISNYGTNAIHLACAKGYQTMDSKGNPVGISNAELVRNLIDAGADPNIISTSGLSALDIAVLRGSEEMVQAILSSPTIQSSTLLNAIHYIESENYTATQNNNLLKKVCSPILEVKDTDISKPVISSIKALLEKKLNEIDPEYTLKQAIEESIEKSIKQKIREITIGTQQPTLTQEQELVKQELLDFAKSVPGSESYCRDFFKRKYNENLFINPQDNNFHVYHNKKKSIIEFKNISPFFGAENEKFNYNKLLGKDGGFDPNFYNKEGEQIRIIEALKNAQTKTIMKYPSESLGNNFFVAVMKVASKNSGIGNITAKKFQEDFNEALRALGDTSFLNYSSDISKSQRLHNIAKYFSKTFQDISRQENYLTGRKGANDKVNLTPRRLFRVCTKENIQKFAEELTRTPSGKVRSYIRSRVRKTRDLNPIQE